MSERQTPSMKSSCSFASYVIETEHCAHVTFAFAWIASFTSALLRYCVM